MARMPRNLDDLPPARVMHGAGKELGGFKKFILRGNVVDLAVGVVIGAAFGNVVQALVKDIITPLLGVFGGSTDASGFALTVGNTRLLVGDFLNALLSFLLIALIVYFLIVLPVNKLMEKYHPAPQPAPTKDCPECTSRIPQAARRCPQCTAQVESPSREAATTQALANDPQRGDGSRRLS